jgi:predicted small lipoprotein YifL
MNRNQGLRRAAGAAVLLAACASLAACGKQGSLEQPAPLFGAKAKAAFEARKAQEAKDDAQRATQRTTTPAAPTSSVQTGNDNAPLTTRDVLDPAQRLSPASSAPLAGAPNPMGAPVQTRP